MSKQGQVSADWIVLRLNEEQCTPTKVGIWNYDGYGYGLKTIKMMASRDGKAYSEWWTIRDIKAQQDSIQYFQIPSKIAVQAAEYKFFKLCLVENHGNEYQNIFIEFQLWGKKKTASNSAGTLQCVLSVW